MEDPRSAAGLIAAAGVLLSAEAQNLPATIAGQVTDETGGLLPGVTLAYIKESEDRRERVVVTDGGRRLRLTIGRGRDH